MLRGPRSVGTIVPCAPGALPVGGTTHPETVDRKPRRGYHLSGGGHPNGQAEGRPRRHSSADRTKTSQLPDPTTSELGCWHADNNEETEGNLNADHRGLQPANDTSAEVPDLVIDADAPAEAGQARSCVPRPTNRAASAASEASHLRLCLPSGRKVSWGERGLSTSPTTNRHQAPSYATRKTHQGRGDNKQDKP